MRIDNPGLDIIKEYNLNLYNYIKSNNELFEIRYLDLGVKVIRILNYSKDFSPLIEKQLTFVLKDKASHYDATIVIWKDDNINELYKVIDPNLDPKRNFKVRIDMIYANRKYDDLWVFDSDYSKVNPIIGVDTYAHIVNSYDKNNEMYFYGVGNLEPEEFIKQGHIFVQILNKILKTPHSNLVHGACVGIDNKGILFCARGQRGKSTLTVLSMLKGFEYVSDDYLTIDAREEKLYASPIYSIITLSPRMYNELYDELDGCKFVSNNARKDKYVINISNLHNQFKINYPLELCMLPEIVSDKNPSIKECTADEKGRAIVQLIQSSVFQMQDINNSEVILKLFNMVKNYKFYKINLCNDILKNTEFLRAFVLRYHSEKTEDTTELPRMLVDITFDIANVLDSQKGIIYTMNKFATNIYENLINGVSKDEILAVLLSFYETSDKIKDLDILIENLNKLGLLNDIVSNWAKPNINFELAKDDNYKFSIIEYKEDGNIELIKEKNKNELCIK